MYARLKQHSEVFDTIATCYYCRQQRHRCEIIDENMKEKNTSQKKKLTTVVVLKTNKSSIHTFFGHHYIEILDVIKRLKTNTYITFYYSNKLIIYIN